MCRETRRGAPTVYLALSQSVNLGTVRRVENPQMALKKKHIEYLQKIQESQKKGGKPPEDPDEKEARDQTRKELLRFLRAIENERELAELLTDHYGLQAGSEQFLKCVRAWRNLKRKF